MNYGNNLVYRSATNYSANMTVKVSDGDITKTSNQAPSTENNYSEVFGDEHLITEDGIYIANKWTFTFPFNGTVFPNGFNNISLTSNGVEVSKIVLEQPIIVNELEQLIVTYYKFAEISDYYYYDGGSDSVVAKTNISYDTDGVENISAVYFNPLHYSNRCYGISAFGPTNDLSAKIKFYSSDISKIVELSYRDVLNFAGGSLDRGSLSASYLYDFTLSPQQIELEDIKYVSFVRRGGPTSLFLAPTIEFETPISKNKKERMRLKLRVSITGSIEELNLENIVPHIQ